MASRTRRTAHSTDIWPGFVDALATLLLVLIFLLVVFVLSEFFLSRALSGRDEALDRLNQQVAELADLLSLEKQANIQLRGDITQLAAQLQASTADRDALASNLAAALGLQAELEKQLRGVAGMEADSEDIRLQLAAAMAMLEAERATARSKREQEEASRIELIEERKISSVAARQLAMLNQQIAALRTQLAALQRALDVSEAEVEEQNVQIVDMGRRLNIALANKVEELSRFRSEFFGRLRKALADRSEVSIEGDRFVIQSGVLFDSASADLGVFGANQLKELANLLIEIETEIPTELKWVLRIDGHTDNRPINTPAFPSNWELSAARAISVAKYLVEQGVPPHRVAAAGFAEFQPLSDGSDEASFRRNRRIELKLTER